jgi:hypothetical protein
MRRTTVLAVALCAVGSFALTASASAATSAGGGSGHANAVPSPAAKPKVIQFCNVTVPGPYNLFIVTNKETKVKTFTIEGFSDEGVVEKLPKGGQRLNELGTFGFMYEGKKVKGTKRYVGSLYFEIGGTPIEGAEWGLGITKEAC